MRLADTVRLAAWRVDKIAGRLAAIMSPVLKKAGVDRAVVFGVLAKIWSLGAGPVTMLLIASRFTPELQGYYFTFGSLLALGVFVELGLGYVVMQFASHEWSRLALNDNGQIVGDSDSLSRLVSIGRFAVRWFAIASGFLAVGLGIAGSVFFSRSPQIGIDWQAPWLALCLLSAVNLCFLPLWSLLEGCGQVSQVYLYRFGQGVLSALSIWSAIFLGAGLWSASLATLVGLIWALAFLYRRYRRFLRSFLAPISGPTISWRFEIWPLQWRIGLSWLTGYLQFSLFTPVAFQLHGPVIAGQMGMTWSLVSAISTISSTWVQTRAPRFGVLVASKDYAGLDRLALQSGVVAFGVAVCGAVAATGLVYLLNVLQHPLADRLLPPLPTGLFLVATVLMQISYVQSTYLRAHKREPFLGLSLVGSLLIGVSTVLLGREYGPIGMAAGYLSVIALVALPVGTVIWYRCRVVWHSSGSGQQI